MITIEKKVKIQDITLEMGQEARNVFVKDYCQKLFMNLYSSLCELDAGISLKDKRLQKEGIKKYENTIRILENLGFQISREEMDAYLSQAEKGKLNKSRLDNYRVGEINKYLLIAE